MLYGITHNNPTTKRASLDKVVLAIDLGTIDSSDLERFRQASAEHPVAFLDLGLIGSSISSTVETLIDSAGSITGFAAHFPAPGPVSVVVNASLCSVPDPYNRPAGPVGTFGVVDVTGTTWFPLVADGAGSLTPLPDADRPVAEALWRSTETNRRFELRNIVISCAPTLFDALRAELGGDPDLVTAGGGETAVRLAERCILAGAVTVVPSALFDDPAQYSVNAVRGHGRTLRIEQHTYRIAAAPPVSQHC
jgi:hypothetical protein